MNDVRIYVYLMKQDDPKKCTSAKLVRFNLATPIYSMRNIPYKGVLLNPFSQHILSPEDKELLKHGLVAIDCSWKNCGEVFMRKWRGIHRRLPTLWAANPIHYGYPSILSSAEALAAALYITGHRSQATRTLSIFKWGPTFFTLNKSVLDDYYECGCVEEVLKVERDYTGSVNH